MRLWFGATMRVDDLGKFAGRIDYDPASRSELVVPLMAGRQIVGVIDLDTPGRTVWTPVMRLGSSGW